MLSAFCNRAALLDAQACMQHRMAHRLPVQQGTARRIADQGLCRRSVQFMVDHQEQYMYNEVPAHMANGNGNAPQAASMEA